MFLVRRFPVGFPAPLFLVHFSLLFPRVTRGDRQNAKFKNDHFTSEAHQ